MSNRALRVWFRFSLASTVLGAVAVVLLYLTGNFGPLLGVRDTMFTMPVHDGEAFWDLPPERLIERGFKTDSPELVREWSDLVESDPGWSARLLPVQRVANPILRAQALVNTISVGGEQGVRSIHDLRKKIDAQLTGYGDCGDHAEVFLALAPVVGLTVREVNISIHGIAEVWTGSRWAFIDPMYAVMARAEDGHYLSLFELRERMWAKSPIDWVLFGKSPGHIRDQRDDDFEFYYLQAQGFGRLILTGGNNVLSVDRHKLELPAVPLPILQGLDFARGLRPKYYRLVDQHDPAARWVAPAKAAMSLLFALWLGGSGAGLVLRRRQKSESQVANT